MTVDLAANTRPAPETARRIEGLFEAQARATPDRIALVHAGRELSYGELDARATALAGRLQALGAGPGVLVGVRLRRTARLVVALLAVLKARAAYLPLDPVYPRERLRYMLADSGSGLLLTEGGTHGDPDFDGAVLDLDEPEDARFARSGEIRGGLPEELAYVIYTSGSTGRPKGVMLGHSAVALIDWAASTFVRGELDRVAATTSVCFDPSIFEIFAPLCTGGAVVLKENGLRPFAPDERPTMLNGVPSMFAQLCRAGAIPDSVRVVNVGGEPLSAALVRDLYRASRVEAVFNHYGPTEATTCATVALVPPDVRRDPPIGRPIAGAAIRLLDPQGAPVAPGRVGEIHIGGPGLALGYLDRPELTDERFVDSGWGRLYRTGDFGHWSEDGQLEFVGRTDDLVKVRGVRIELAEVESALSRLPGVENAVAAVRPDPNGRQQLVAWVQSPAPLNERELRARLREQAPDHMTPARLIVVRELPLTLSGKIDRNALPSPPPAPAPSGHAPESRIEEAISEIFKEVLGRERVGRDDSFFELGGDSLAGVTAALRLQELLGYEIPSALLHQAPTPREFAAALEGCPLDAAPHLVTLRDGGPETPLFCLSDLFGRPFSYLSLARRLGARRRVFGLSPGPLERAFVQRRSIPDLTRALAGEVRRVRPQGPYLVAGYSAGGMLAFDLACALESEGAETSLVLIDSSVRGGGMFASPLARWAARRVIEAEAPADDSTSVGRMRARAGKLARALTGPEATPAWIPPGKAALAAALMAACSSYRPERFHGPAIIFKARERERVDALRDLDGEMGWGRSLAGPVRVVAVDGNHHSIMREPRVEPLARELDAFLEREGERPGRR